MKEKSLTSILIAVLLVFVCAAALLGFLYNRRITELRQVQASVSAMQNGNMAVQVIATDVIEYSTKNSAIDPILQSFGLKQATNVAQPAKTTAPKK